jgi:hypothetical protein
LLRKDFYSYVQGFSGLPEALHEKRKAIFRWLAFSQFALSGFGMIGSKKDSRPSFSPLLSG